MLEVTVKYKEKHCLVQLLLLTSHFVGVTKLKMSESSQVKPKENKVQGQ